MENWRKVYERWEKRVKTAAWLEGKAEGEARGKAKGKAEGEAQAILTVLEARGLEVPDKVRKVVLSCTDLAQLDAWVRAAVTTPSAAALLTPIDPTAAGKTRKKRPQS